MSLTSPYSEIYYVGNGSTTQFAFGQSFEAPAEANVKCIIYFDEGTSCVPTFTVDTTTGYITIVTLTKPDGTVLTAPPEGSVVRIFRDTPEQQNVTASQLQNYTAKQLEKIFDSIVAMVQENAYDTQHKTIRSTETQRDISLQKLTEEEDQALLYWDEETSSLKATSYGQDELIAAVERANNVADEAKGIAQTTQGNLTSHVQNLTNPHQTSIEKLTDVNISDLQQNQFLSFNGIKWVNVDYSATVVWGGIFGDITDQTDLKNALDGKVNDTGDTMSGALDIIGSSNANTNILNLGNGSTTNRHWHFQPSYSTQSMSLFCGSTETNGYRFVSTGFCPASNNARYLGASSLKWNTIYVTKINNGGNISVPTGSGTMALLSDVALAANSGTQLFTTGVWYAKMDEHSTVPSYAEVEGRNYADFSQTEKDQPIIVVYEYHNSQWVEVERIIPPEAYNGYVTVTSKIWDIQEQAGQQGGKVLWSHTNRTFTPYPLIISFEDIQITGDSTVIMPLNPSGNQIVNKDYVDNHIPTGNFYHPDLFDWKWADHQLNDVQWLRADTFSWQSGAVYEAAFWDLFYDMQVSTYWYSSGSPAYTKSRTPEAGDAVYLNSDLTTQIGTVEAYDDVNDEITVSGDTYSYMSNTYVTPTTETVAGYTVTVYTGHSGKKIVSVSDETNVANIYTATGVAWYYIIDIPNKRFKLPRTQYGVTGLRDTVGNYVPESLPNITGDLDIYKTGYNGFNQSSSGCFSLSSGSKAGDGSPEAGTSTKISLNANDSSSTYQDSAPVQQRATQMYLYFYVGEFTQSAVENTAGLNAELFNDKANVDLDNVSATGISTFFTAIQPDLTTGVSVSSSGFTSTKKQWLLIKAGANNNYFNVLVNGVIVFTIYSTASTNASTWYPLDVGDVVTFAGTSSYFDCITYDMKGI